MFSKSPSEQKVLNQVRKTGRELLIRTVVMASTLMHDFYRPVALSGPERIVLRAWKTCINTAFDSVNLFLMQSLLFGINNSPVSVSFK